MIVMEKKNRERVVLLGIIVTFLFLIGGGVYLQKQKKVVKESKPRVSPTKIEIKLDRNREPLSQNTVSTQKTSFYLKPLPGELMNQIADLDFQDESVATKKFSGLHVMWPVYFFSLQKDEKNHVTVILDVSEDGFGVVISCDADIHKYPEISEIESGKKIWIAGEILAVDPTGTGTIYMKTDYFRFTDLEESGESVKAANH